MAGSKLTRRQQQVLAAVVGADKIYDLYHLCDPAAPRGPAAVDAVFRHLERAGLVWHFGSAVGITDAGRYELTGQVEFLTKETR